MVLKFVGGRIYRSLSSVISTQVSLSCSPRNYSSLYQIDYCASGSGISLLRPAQLIHKDVWMWGNAIRRLDLLRGVNFSSIEMKAGEDVVRFCVQNSPGVSTAENKLPLIEGRAAVKKKRPSRKAMLKELRFFRLKAKKKLKSPNPEVRIKYKLEKAKRKEVWLIEKLMKFVLPKAAPEIDDPEMLTEEERFYLKRTGDKKKHYVPVGRRGVFGGVVLNMHLHWKRHETIKVVCKPCKPGQIHEIAAELARLSKGIPIDVKPNNIIIFYRGKNYVRPDIMSPPDTLSKNKALEKYKYEQSLEHTSEFIERLEEELEQYQEHLARFKRAKENMPHNSACKS